MKRLLLALGLMVASALPAFAQGDLSIDQKRVPTTSNVGFRVHGSTTAVNLTLAHGDIRAVGGYKVAYVFSHQVAVVGSLLNSHAPLVRGVSGGADHQLVVMPYTGSIIAVTIQSTAAITTGSAHAEAVVWTPPGGTVQDTGFVAEIGATGFAGTTYATNRQARDTGRTFSQGDLIGCQINTTSNIAPTTAGLACTIVVEY